MVSVSGNVADEDTKPLHAALNAVADRISLLMSGRGWPRHLSPLFRPWNLAGVVDEEKLIAVFSPLSGGIAEIRWIDRRGEVVPVEAVVLSVQRELGRSVSAIITLPMRSDAPVAD